MYVFEAPQSRKGIWVIGFKIVARALFQKLFRLELLANMAEAIALGLNTRGVTLTTINIGRSLFVKKKTAQKSAPNGEPGTAGTCAFGNADEEHNRNTRLHKKMHRHFASTHAGCKSGSQYLPSYLVEASKLCGTTP